MHASRSQRNVLGEIIREAWLVAAFLSVIPALALGADKADIDPNNPGGPRKETTGPKKHSGAPAEPDKTFDREPRRDDRNDTERSDIKPRGAPQRPAAPTDPSKNR